MKITAINIKISFDPGIHCILLFLAVGLSLITNCEKLFAQRNSVISNESFWNPKMIEIAKPASIPGWIRFKENIRLNDPEQFFEINREAFGLDNNINMILIRVKSDEIGFTHYRYQQKYKDINVEGCEFIVHEKNRNISKTDKNRKTTFSLNDYYNAIEALYVC